MQPALSVTRIRTEYIYQEGMNVHDPALWNSGLAGGGADARLRDEEPLRGAAGQSLGSQHWTDLQHAPAPGARRPDRGDRRARRPGQAGLSSDGCWPEPA